MLKRTVFIQNRNSICTTIQKFVVSNFFKKVIPLFWRDVDWIQGDIKYLLLENLFLLNKCCSFLLCIHKRKNYHMFQKQLSSTVSTLIIIQHIRMISEDHVTLKTGGMMRKIQLGFTGINCILKYIKQETNIRNGIKYFTILLFFSVF